MLHNDEKDRLTTLLPTSQTIQSSDPTLARPYAVLLDAKFARPRLPIALVGRARLLHALDAAHSHRITLLSAAAGWGKTTLLSTWLTTHPHPAAWVSLDELDNDPARFWAAVIAALRTCLPNVGTLALAMLHSSEPPPLTTILTALLNELGAIHDPLPLLLILDDFHVINDPAIHEGLTYLVEHLPTHLHVVLATRIDPDLPLARWRVRGDLVEMRAADLRFTAEETTSFFTHVLGDLLSSDEVQRLEQRTEGWVAGLQLAALALRQHADHTAFVQAFTGSHRYLLDYVQEEILQCQPLPVQRFLLHTAVLPRLNAGVCAALTEDAASQEMLEWLERNNLFVVPLDDERQWYRLHDLFREVLLARLHTTQPALVPTLHQRAAHWYAAQNELRQAIAHALTAADFAYAAELMEREAPRMWLQGEAQTVHAWIGTLPDAILLRHARLALDAGRRLLEAFHLTVRDVYARVQPQLEQRMARLEALLQLGPESTVKSETEQVLPILPLAEVTLLQRRIRLLRALIETRTLLAHGDAVRMHLLAQETEALTEQEEMTWKLIALSINFWLIESIQRQSALLIPKLLAAKQQAIDARDRLTTGRVMRMLAFAYLRNAQTRLAEQECLAALDLMKQIGEHSAMSGYYHYFLAGVYYDWNQLDKSAHSLQELLHLARTWQQADLLIAGTTVLVMQSLASADLTAAEAALDDLEALVQQERSMSATHAGGVIGVRVNYWLTTGNLDAASNWAAQVAFSPENWNPNHTWEFLMLVRVYLARQQYTEAVAALDRFSSVLDRPGDTANTIDFLALQVIALHCAGQRAHAYTVAQRLLALTAAEGYIRLYLNGGEPMRQVLQDLLDSTHAQKISLPPASVAFIAKLLAAFAQEAQRRSEQSQASSLKPHLSRAPLESYEALIEPLTRREEETLRLLVSGASNQEIASQLVVSLATVKKHVSNILGKLGVASRSQAIARAREWPHLS